MFFAHGGLVDEREGLRPVLARRRFWEMNGIYPVYFVWETGIRETLSDIVRQAGGSSRAGRGALTDAAIEALARTGGKQTWGQMKKSAENGAKASGGQRLVAELAAGLWRSLGGEIEFHAAGHSAGAILHSHFLPLLVSQPANGAPAVSVSSLQLLAPAITVENFKTRLQPLVGSGKSIASLTTYTMSDEFEQDDESLNPYGKSLLYLVRAAFEDERNTPILGIAARSEAGPEDDPLLRPRRNREGGRHRLLEERSGVATRRPLRVHYSRRLRQRHRDDDQPGAPRPRCG